MSTKLVITDKSDFVAVEIWWSKRYACPIYKVGEHFYIEETGEYAGYFDEAVIDLVATNPDATKGSSNPPNNAQTGRPRSQ